LYAILDIETTGGKFNEEGITEIAIHKFDGLQVVDSFISLVNPEIPIQPFVANLTHINNKMLVNAPKFYEVAKRILEITDDCILVAHNSKFDYRILKTEFKRLGFNFERKTLCTVILSKKLIPNVESYSLGKLCRSLGITVSDRHRANGDALATIKLFKLLLAKDTKKEIIQNSILTENSENKLAPQLVTILDSLPTVEGIYYIHDIDKNIVFIGKGKNIAKSVNQLFLKKTKNVRSILKKIDSVSFEITGNELIGNLKYKEELMIIQPKFNRLRKRNYPRVTFNSDNMMLINKGRTIEERSVVLIENNELMGYCFVNLSYQINNLEILRTLISPMKSDLHSKFIIKNHLLRKKVDKIVRF